jgi:hypothetical protein
MFPEMNVKELNNNAIAFFQRGFHNDAVVCLRAAIDQLVRNLRGQVTTISNETALTVENWINAEPTRLFGISSQQNQTKSAFMSLVVIEPPSDVGDDYAATTMYNSAVLLTNDVLDIKTESYVDETSVVLLYNLAFINHWVAVHHGVSTGLPKALKLYEMALEIIHENRSPSIESLLCAIWNNMGHIHIQLFQLDEARLCFSSLWLILQHRTDIREQLPPYDFNNFLLSAISQAGELHLAPAA